MKNMRRGHLKISLLLYMFKSFHIGLSKPDNMVRMWWIGNNMRIVISFIAGSNDRCRYVAYMLTPTVLEDETFSARCYLCCT